MGDSIHARDIGHRIRTNTEILSDIKRKYFRNVNDYGWRIAAKKGGAFLIRPLFQKMIYYLYELDLGKGISEPSDLIHGRYTLKMVTSEESETITQIEAMEEWLKGTLCRRLEKNCLCMALFDGVKVIGFTYAAVGEGNIPLLRLKVMIGPDKAWSEQISISKDYRRKGLADLLRKHFYRELKQRNITALYGHRQEFNVASRQSARKFTSKIFAKVNYIKILKYQRLQLFIEDKNFEKKIPPVIIKPNLKKTTKKTTGFESQIPPLFVVEIDNIR